MTGNNKIDIHESIQPYLNEIAERLWSGHAAVMIGAGFSKNARSNGTSCPGFPDWSQLGDLFYEKIYCKKPDDQKYLNVLKLAAEFEAAFGRPSLDKLLRSSIPDTEYEPSQLHSKILGLLWSDVFTTNYDTLLERACSSVIERKYTIVVNKEDLVYSKRPRIIKLHGSFPSERPFIITEEDYRLYPIEFAPFINTVQQALLENTLCLIGFSGDDPNFLQWIGWIRDNLGKQNSPKIYLIGAFQFSDAQKKLFEQRNIVVVDFAICSEVENDHYGALELFCEYLLSRKSEDNRLDWPSAQESPYPDLNSTDKIAQLQKLLPNWKAQRLSYPGWCVLPEERRSSLWSYTRSWINFINPNDNIPHTLDIEFAYELNWRIEKCLCPILDSQTEVIERLLSKYWPFADIEPSNKECLTPEKSVSSELDWANIRKMWLHLFLSMMRFYREKGLLDKWQKTNDRVNVFDSYLSQEQQAFLNYERVLSALFALNLNAVKSELEAWSPNEALPFWEAKRACLLAEIGKGKEARTILEQSLENIRAKINLEPERLDYPLMSQEAYIIILIQYVSDAANSNEGNWSRDEELRQQFMERLILLQQDECDPWNELKLFKSRLERPPVIKQPITTKQEFDIGRITQFHHIGGDNEEAIAAYAFLRFCEEAGLSFRIPGSTIGKNSAEGTLSRIANYSPYWASATMVRIGDEEVVDHLFNRESLQKMSIATIDKLIVGYFDAITGSWDDIQSGGQFKNQNFGTLLARVIPEILSRLCCKCSNEARDEILELLTQIYKSNKKRNFSKISNLTMRLMESYSQRQQFERISKFLEFSIVDDSDFIIQSEYRNPFWHLNVEKKYAKEWDQPKLDKQQIEMLLNNAGSTTPEKRKWSTSTLIKLHHLDLLEKSWADNLGDILWKDLDEFGLPTNTNFYKFAFLDLPHPEEADPKLLVKNFIQKSSFPIQKNKEEPGVAITGGMVPLCDEIVGASKHIQWSKEEIFEIFDRLISWWESDKKYLKKNDEPSFMSSIPDEFRARFAKLVDVLVDVIVPALDEQTDKDIKNKISLMISEMKESGIPTFRLETACLHIFPDTKDEVINHIEKSLTSNDISVVSDGLRSVMTALKNGSTISGDDKNLTKLLFYLGQMIKWKKKTGLQSALSVVTFVLNEHPSHFVDDFETTVLSGLGELVVDTDLAADADEMDFSEKLVVRKEAAQLAFILYKFYEEQGKVFPDTIKKWKKICASEEEFAEIRNQWVEI